MTNGNFGLTGEWVRGTGDSEKTQNDSEKAKVVNAFKKMFLELLKLH